MPVDTLSGGWRRRVLLARALVAQPDVLVLDEPTNHLDIDAIAWLEAWLLEYPGALVFVTHDRVFLERVATRIVELDRGRLTSWPGDYATFIRKKEEWLENERLQQAKFDKKLAEEEVWIRQGIKARRTRNEGRVKALEAMRQERAERRERLGSVRLSAERAESTGKMVFEAEGVSKAYGGAPIVRDLSLRVQRGDRIGLVGPNGAGKTTLLRLLLGDIAPDAGEVRRGANVQVAYYDQQREQLDPERTVFDTVGDGNDTVTVNGGSKHVHGYLRDFLFSPERARSPVKALSGGERNRLLLARLFTRPANVLVLDEPTNDLDLETLELLEAELVAWTGHAADRQPRSALPRQRRHQHPGVRGRRPRRGIRRRLRRLGALSPRDRRADVAGRLGRQAGRRGRAGGDAAPPAPPTPPRRKAAAVQAVAPASAPAASALAASRRACQSQAVVQGAARTGGAARRHRGARGRARRAAGPHRPGRSSTRRRPRRSASRWRASRRSIPSWPPPTIAGTPSSARADAAVPYTAGMHTRLSGLAAALLLGAAAWRRSSRRRPGVASTTRRGRRRSSRSRSSARSTTSARRTSPPT